MPLYGHELSEAIDPYQAGLGFAVNLRDRTFPGREALGRVKAEGSERVRIGLELAGRRVAREGYGVFERDRPVGEVTSGTFSPTLQKSIAMAYVRREAGVLGVELQVDVRGRREPARAVPLPFYQRAREGR
jgi:aminomethyltransferase